MENEQKKVKFILMVLNFAVLAVVAIVLILTVKRASADDVVPENAAAEDWNYRKGERSIDLVNTNMINAARAMMGEREAAMLMHAMMLQMTKYDMDMKTASGRAAWHGKMIYEDVRTNDLCKIEVYSNEVTGAVWKYRNEFVPKVAPKKLPPVMSTNGIPAKLAAARARRNAALQQGTVVTNVAINAN